MQRALALCLLTAASLMGNCDRIRAGGGPENVFLVVNGDSPASMTIANHFAKLRQVAAGNILVLSWGKETEMTDVATFRKEILAPTLQAIEKRRLAPQIDYIVYSSDFPWAIDFTTDTHRFLEAAKTPDGASAKKKPWPNYLGRAGSINGMTYLWEAVMTGSAAYVQFDSNYYMRPMNPPSGVTETLGFSGRQRFDSRGRKAAADTPSRRYLLSTVLGITSGRGNSTAEVLSYLKRGAQADGTAPPGTIYFMRNSDIRSRVRHDHFPSAAKKLRALGVAAEIIEGTVPRNRTDVMGTMVGTASFNWRSSGSRILPGAICEHFTSFGGKMRVGAGQTPLSEFLRHGAAGASGTIVEPLSVHQKFPHPMMHVHYARGCTLAEAFYQSVHAPYQLLIVGDPLCRPWAKIPKVRLGESIPQGLVRGEIELTPSATIAGGGKIARFELFIDGWRRGQCKPGAPLTFDTTRLADGYHDVRVIAVEDGSIASQGRILFSMTTANHGRTITASALPAKMVGPTSPLTITARSIGSTTIAVLHNSRVVGQIAGESGRVVIDKKKLGLGPVKLQIVAVGKGGAKDYVTAEPIELTLTTNTR